jgi:uncharacterized protein (DUF433 family)
MTYPHISRDPGILGGKPVIAGTRISVDIILELLSSGMSAKDIVRQYPQLTEEFVREALAYAATDIRRSEIDSIRRPR